MPRLRRPGIPPAVHRRRRSPGLALLLLLVALAAPCPALAVSASAGGGDVPVPYAKLYDELARKLVEFGNRLGAAPAGSPRPLRGFACLPEADGRQGSALLEYGVLQGCQAMLDGLRDMGVTGVKVAIPYPLLVPDQAHAPEYLEFYARLAGEVRRRGLALYVHMTPAFRSPVLAGRRGEDPAASLDHLAQVARSQAEVVLATLRPDLLGLLNEPGNAARVVGIPALATGEGLARFLDAVTRDLAHNGTRLAAGLGSWDEPELAAALVTSPGVELVDIHVGPLAGKHADWLAQADEYAELARVLGKPAALGEVWLAKVSTFSVAVRRPEWRPAEQEVLRRDVYGFWSPLDTAFLRLMARLARTRGLEFLCPAQPRCLFSYLEYQAGMEQTAYAALLRKADDAAFAALRGGDLSRTGEALRDILRANR